MKTTAIFLSVLGALPSTYAWGALGHETVGYVASNFLQPQTVAWAQNILKDTTSSYLANVASWADSYRATTAGKFSAPFHFIDALDNPPSTCGVSYSRDCGKSGCVVSAINNYVGPRWDVFSTEPMLMRLSRLPASEVLPSAPPRSIWPSCSSSTSSVTSINPFTTRILVSAVTKLLANSTARRRTSTPSGTLRSLNNMQALLHSRTPRSGPTRSRRPSKLAHIAARRPGG